MQPNKKLVEQKIYEKWLPKLKARYEEKGFAVSEAKMKKIAKLCHTRKLYESAYATTSSVNGRGAFNFGNNPAVSTYGTSYQNQGSGEVFQNLFGVFVDAAATTFGMDLLPILTMTKSNLTVFIAEPIYADGRIDATAEANKPLLFKVAIELNGVPTDLAIGTTYTIKTAFSGGENVMDVIYVGKDRIEGDAIFRVGQQYNNTGGGGTDWTNETIAQAVTAPNAIFFSAINFWSFDYTTADYVSGFNNYISGYTGAGLNDTQNWFANRNDGKTNTSAPMSRETGESTYYRSLGLRNWSRNYMADTFNIDIEYTTEQIQDMKMDHDVDAVEIGDMAMQDQLSQSINDYILSAISAHGWSNHFQINQVNGFNLNAYFAAGGTGTAQTFAGKTGTQLTISGPSGALPSSGAIAENLSTIQRRLISRLLYASAVVNNRCRKGKGDTTVMNGTFSTAVKDIRGYTPAVFENNINDAGLHVFGSFNGLQCYEDALMDLTEERVMVFRHGQDKDPGLKLCTYLLAEKISTIAEGTMATKEALKSRFTLAGVGSYPELNYFTFTVQQASGFNII